MLPSRQTASTFEATNRSIVHRKAAVFTRPFASDGVMGKAQSHGGDVRKSLRIFVGSSLLEDEAFRICHYWDE